MIYLLPWSADPDILIFRRKLLIHKIGFGLNGIWYSSLTLTYNFNSNDEKLTAYSFNSEREVKKAYDKLLIASGKYFLIPEEDADKYKILL